MYFLHFLAVFPEVLIWIQIQVVGKNPPDANGPFRLFTGDGLAVWPLQNHTKQNNTLDSWTAILIDRL